jgi:hypothetical protein
MKRATWAAIFAGTVLLVFVVIGFVIAVMTLPSGGHQGSGLLLGDTDLGPPWVAVAVFVVALGLTTRDGWLGRVGAVIIILAGLGYAVAQLSSLTTWFTGGRPAVGVFVVASIIAAAGAVASAAWSLAARRGERTST